MKFHWEIFDVVAGGRHDGGGGRSACCRGWAEEWVLIVATASAYSEGGVMIRSRCISGVIGIVDSLLIGASTIWTTRIARTSRRTVSDSSGSFTLFAHRYLETSLLVLLFQDKFFCLFLLFGM